MSTKNIEFDVIKIIKEVSRQGISDFELEYGDLKIRLKGEQKQESQEVNNIPTASKEQLHIMEQQEEKTLFQRIEEQDLSLLEELDFIAPELAGDLQRNNIIKLGANGNYEFVEKEDTYA